MFITNKNQDKHNSVLLDRAMFRFWSTLFNKQISEALVTVTDSKIERYFMTIQKSELNTS